MKICFKERIFKEMNQFNMRQPFIIAEMSGNHNQSLNRALEIVDLAAEAGVDALKIQTYTADTMTIDKNDGEFFIEDKRSLWKGESLYSLYQKHILLGNGIKRYFKDVKKKELSALVRLLISHRLIFWKNWMFLSTKLRLLKMWICL